MKFAAIVLCAALVGCAAQPEPTPIIKTQTVNIPVALHCKPDIGPQPDYPDTPTAIAAAKDIFARIQLILSGRVMRIQREAELTAAVEGCE